MVGKYRFITKQQQYVRQAAQDLILCASYCSGEALDKAMSLLVIARQNNPNYKPVHIEVEPVSIPIDHFKNITSRSSGYSTANGRMRVPEQPVYTGHTILRKKGPSSLACIGDVVNEELKDATNL